MKDNIKQKRGRPSKGESKPFTFRLHISVLVALEELQSSLHMTKTAIIEDAIMQYMDVKSRESS